MTRSLVAHSHLILNEHFFTALICRVLKKSSKEAHSRRSGIRLARRCPVNLSVLTVYVSYPIALAVASHRSEWEAGRYNSLELHPGPFSTNTQSRATRDRSRLEYASARLRGAVREAAKTTQGSRSREPRDAPGVSALFWCHFFMPFKTFNVVPRY